jgi:hypothetical protein
VAKRWMRRLLEVEQLETRVYLSGLATAAGSLRTQRHGVAPAIGDQGRSGVISPVEVQAISSPNGALSILVVDVNGFADSSDAILATFDSDTGALLTTASVSGGQFILVTNSSRPIVQNSNYTSSNGSSSSLGWLQVVDQQGTILIESSQVNDQANVENVIPDQAAPAQNPAGGVESNGQHDADPPTSVTREPQPGARPPVIVVFPHGRLPRSIHNGAELNGAETSTPARSDSDPALIFAPAFPSWFSTSSQSPWWSRVTELQGVQARVNDLFSRPLQDADQLGHPSFRSREALDSLGLPTMADGSRLLIRAPSHLMVFAMPRAIDSSATAGSELAIYNFTTGELKRPGYSVMSRLVRSGNEIAFLSTALEEDAGWIGDQASDIPVLQFFNPSTFGVRSTGIRAESLRVQDGQLILGVRNSAQAVAGAESDGLAAYRFDPTSSQLVDLHQSFDSSASQAALLSHGDNRRIVPLPIPFAVADELSGMSSQGLATALMRVVPIDVSTGQSTHDTLRSNPEPANGGPAGPPTPGGSSGEGSSDSGSASPGE